MAYADRSMSGSRIVAIVIVALIHVALGYAFVTGLAYQYVKKIQEDLNTFEVEEPPPPPEEVPPPPPPPDQPVPPPPVVTPPAIVRTQTPAPVIQSVPKPPPVFIPTPVVAPPPPPPPPPRVDKSAQPRGNPGNYFGPDAYPSSALRAGESGRVSARLTIGTDGRVSDCTVVSSSGSNALDEATCNIARRRVRFTAAKDQNGDPITSTYPLNVSWRLPD